MADHTSREDRGRSAGSRRLLLAGCVAVLLLALFAVAASGTTIRVSIDSSGEGLAVHVAAGSGSRCVLRVNAQKHSTTFAPVRIGRTGHAAITWTVPAGAPSGTWSFVMSCSKDKRVTTSKAHIELINHGAGDGSLVGVSGQLGGKGGGQQSCAAVAVGGPPSEVCFIGDPFAIYQDGTDVGQCTWYAAGERPDLDGITTGNASQWLAEARGKVPEGGTPVVGSIAVNTTADVVDGVALGHVAYVAGVTDGGATLILDEANVKNDEKVYLNIATPASDFAGYIYGGPAGNGPTPAVTTPAPTTTPTPTTPPATTTPTTPTSPAPTPQTYSETPGSVVHTWTDYADAGGTEGPTIPSNETVQIACKVTGFAVADGNTWWYKIASSPWSGTYYGSADAFYNDGATSGSLIGTPFVDPNVPNC